MTHKKLVYIADKAYPDSCVSCEWEEGLGTCGDSLASFVVRELGGVGEDARSDEEALSVAEDRMRTAAKELTAVANAFLAARTKLVSAKANRRGKKKDVKLAV